jgi:hypothetical protein
LFAEYTPSRGLVALVASYYHPSVRPELDPRLSASREDGNCCRHRALGMCRARTSATEAFGLIKAERTIGIDTAPLDGRGHSWLRASVFEAFALAGPLVAELLGVPGVAHMFGPLPPQEAVEHANDAVSPIWRSYGWNVPGWTGMYRHLTIQICPPMLETAHVPAGQTWHLRPVPLPGRPRELTERPVVYVTSGLSSTTTSIFSGLRSKRWETSQSTW